MENDKNLEGKKEKMKVEIKPASNKKAKVSCRCCHKIIRSKNPERKFCNVDCLTSWIVNIVKSTEAVTKKKERTPKRVRQSE